jgi:site-specific recombinase XerC
LKALVLDSVSSPITRRVYNLGLDEFIGWYGQAPRPGFTKATVNAWRTELEARGLGSVSINVRITAVRKLAAEAADNGLLAPELAAGIKGVKGRQVDGRAGRQLGSGLQKVIEPAEVKAKE